MNDRPIKFRAWLKVEQQMLHEGWNGERFVTTANMFELGDSAIRTQFTGLKDKNGVEIFEGDIVSARSLWGGPDSKLPKVKVPFIESDFVVGWQGIGWSLKDLNFKERGGYTHIYGDWYRYVPMLPTDDYYRERYQVTVIGNIHENPELLVLDTDPISTSPPSR